MDNVTHTLFALTLARTPLWRAGRGTAVALVLASNAPDIDFISAARGGLASYLQWHRGPTHGLLGVIGLGVITAALARLACRFRSATGRQEPDASFHVLVAISMLGVLLHILMDLPTSYGTRLFSPFDWHWYAADWLPILDVYLLTALAAGLVLGYVSPEARRRNAAIVLALMAANYGLRGFTHQQAMDLGLRLFSPTVPQPCGPGPGAPLIEHWPHADAGHPSAPAGSRCLVGLAATPTFLSPFRWRVIAQFANAYEIQDVDLLDAQTGATPGPGGTRRTVRYPNVWTAAVDKAAATRTAQMFLGFARFPAARAFLDRGGVATVRWLDVRFVGGPVRLDRPVEALGPFVVTVRIGADGQMEERMGP